MTKQKVIEGLKCHAGEDSCDECPYKSLHGVNSMTCPQHLALDALDLLKKQEPRVLTIEEISNDNIETAYFETKAGMLRGCVIEPNAICESYFYIVCGLNDDVYWRDSKGYNITWRCWTSRPTKEQMQDTPWKGDK